MLSASGLLEKWLNSYPFQGYTHGFESRTGHHIEKMGLMREYQSFFRMFCFSNNKLLDIKARL